MTILFDPHTHTRYSRSDFHHHGKGTVSENARAAKKQKIGLCIADHGPGHMLFGIRHGDYVRLKADIDEANAAAGRKVVLLGVEANLMNADGETDAGLLPIEPELLLMGYHKGVYVRGASARKLLYPTLLSPQKCRDLMTDAVVKAFARYPIDILTHPGEYVPIDMKRVAAAAVSFGVTLELNEKHPMAEEDLAEALRAGAHFVVSSDAHRPDAVGRVSGALRQAENAKIPKERIVNSGSYPFDKGLRMDRLCGWAASLADFSTGQK